MTTFKEISVEDYKKLLDNKQHTFAKTFKNIELLQKFEDRKYKNDNIDDIIDEEQKLKKKIHILKNYQTNYLKKLIKIMVNYLIFIIMIKNQL